MTAKPGKNGTADPGGRPQAPTSTPYGALLRSAREWEGLTLEKAARRAGVSISHWSRVERGVVTPSVAAHRRMASAVGLDPARTLPLAGMA